MPSEMPSDPYDASRLTPGQRARASAAVDAWFTNPGGSDYRAPGWTVSDKELVSMHAALEAPDLDDALLAFGFDANPQFTSPEEYEEGRCAMQLIRQQLGIDTAAADPDGVTALVAMSNPMPLSLAARVRMSRVLHEYTEATVHRETSRTQTEPEL